MTTAPTPATPSITDDVIDIATSVAKGAAGGMAGGWLGAVIAGGIAGVEELLAILRSHPSPTTEISLATDALSAGHAILTAAQTAQQAPGATTATVVAAAQAAAIPAVVSAAESAVPVILGAAMQGSGPVTKSNGTGDLKGKDLDRAQAAARVAPPASPAQ